MFCFEIFSHKSNLTFSVSFATLSLAAKCFFEGAGSLPSSATFYTAVKKASGGLRNYCRGGFVFNLAKMTNRVEVRELRREKQRDN